MEFVTIFLSSLLTLASPVNLIGDKIVEDAIRSNVYGVDEVAVRIDNTPNYQVLNGKVDRARIATRGLQLSSKVRIEALEVDLDRIDANLDELRSDETWIDDREVLTVRLRQLVREPLQLATRIVLTEEDINRALESETVNAQATEWIAPLIESSLNAPASNYDVLRTQVDLLENDRILLQINLQDLEAEDVERRELELKIEAEVFIAAGQTIRVTDPSVLINGTTVSPEVLAGVQRALEDPTGTILLEELGILIRTLNFDVDREKVEWAMFIRIEAVTVSAVLEIEELLEFFNGIANE